MPFEFRDCHGGLGSCLHKEDNGYFIAYARWPSRQLWEKKTKKLSILILWKK